MRIAAGAYLLVKRYQFRSTSRNLHLRCHRKTQDFRVCSIS